MEIWEREAAFEELLREAARAAKTRHNSIDLFRYFERAYADTSGTGNFFIGISELCMLTTADGSGDCRCACYCLQIYCGIFLLQFRSCALWLKL